jgi:hypothetical protein
MIDMLKRHEIQVLRRAGHSQEEEAVGLQRGFGVRTTTRTSAHSNAAPLELADPRRLANLIS